MATNLLQTEKLYSSKGLQEAVLGGSSIKNNNFFYSSFIIGSALFSKSCHIHKGFQHSSQELGQEIKETFVVHSE
jgi:hypothetical protein